MKAKTAVARRPRPIEWKPIPGYAGIYSITRIGRIWSHQRKRVAQGHWLKSTPTYVNGKGSRSYLTVDLKNRQHYIHHLVMAAWGVPKPSPLHEINHKDGDKHNNSIDNLEWVTRKENNAHAAANGLWHPIRGSQIPNAKVTEAEVGAMRDRFAKGTSVIALAQEFGLHRNTANRIIHRYGWKHV